MTAPMDTRGGLERVDRHMIAARALVEAHIADYGMVPHPDRLKEAIAAALSGVAQAPRLPRSDNDRHFLSAIQCRLEQLYELSDDPRLREQISDEVDWIETQYDNSLAAQQPLMEQPQYIVEGIILRRLHERRIEGYTIETAKEIVEALALSSTDRAPAPSAWQPDPRTIEECAKVADAEALANKNAANSIFESGDQKSAICFMDAARACEALAVKIRASLPSSDRGGVGGHTQPRSEDQSWTRASANGTAA